MNSVEEHRCRLRDRLGEPGRLEFPPEWEHSGSWKRAQRSPAHCGPANPAEFDVLLGYPGPEAPLRQLSNRAQVQRVKIQFGGGETNWVMPPERSSLELLELGLAAALLLPWLAFYAGVPYPFPTWPSVAGLPANPELLVPGALGLVALIGAAWDLLVADGIDLVALAVSVLAAITLWWAAISWYVLYAPTEGGVYIGGLLSLASGVVLAVAVILRRASRAGIHRRGAAGGRRKLGR